MKAKAIGCTSYIFFISVVDLFPALPDLHTLVISDLHVDKEGFVLLKL